MALLINEAEQLFGLVMIRPCDTAMNICFF